MAELSGYFGAPIPSGSEYVWGQIDWTTTINPGVDAVRNNLIFAGWTNPTLMDGDLDGIKATGTLTFLGFPCHTDGSDGSGVPDTFGGAFAGTFDGKLYQFFDPLAEPPDADPSGPTTIGVPLSACGPTGAGALNTTLTFCALASAATRWTFTVRMGSTASGGFIDVVAKHTGTSSNVDPYQGSWTPTGDYLAGEGPVGGGWNVYSTPAPSTGDQFKLTIYEGNFPTLGVGATFEMPYGSGNLINYQLNRTLHNVGFGPYQLVFQIGATAVPGDRGLGLQFALVSALSVPDEFGPVTYSIVGVTNIDGSAPCMITTSVPHNMTAQDRCKISGVLGATHVNGSFWVAKVVSPTQFFISVDPLDFLFGDDHAYTSGGTVFEVGTTNLLNITAVQNVSSLPVLLTTSVPHGYVIGTIVDMASVGGISHLLGVYSVADVPSPNTFKIATFDMGLVEGDGHDYISGGVLTTGIFNAMVAFAEFPAFMDNGLGVNVSAQGITGNFPLHVRNKIDGTSFGSSTEPHTVAINIPFSGVGPNPLPTTAGKQIIVAPYIAVRITGNQEARMLGNLWDSYVELDNHTYGEVSQTGLPGFGESNFMAWLFNNQPLPLVTATLWMRVNEIINNILS